MYYKRNIFELPARRRAYILQILDFPGKSSFYCAKTEICFCIRSNSIHCLYAYLMRQLPTQIFIICMTLNIKTTFGKAVTTANRKSTATVNSKNGWFSSLRSFTAHLFEIKHWLSRFHQILLKIIRDETWQLFSLTLLRSTAF